MYPGVDILEIERFALACARRPRLCERIFSAREREELAGRRIESWAVRFAAKEAVLKAIGTGLAGFSWHDIEIVASRTGEPLVYLSPRVEAKVRERGGTSVHVSLSHNRTQVVAMAILS